MGWYGGCFPWYLVLRALHWRKSDGLLQHILRHGVLGNYTPVILVIKFPLKNFWLGGMFLQGLALTGLVWATIFTHYLSFAILLGIGTAMVYPAFLSGMAKFTHPSEGPISLGIFRMWRDLGYAIGALLTGIIADKFGFNATLLLTGVITIISGIIFQVRFRNA